jgi:hypothetical protein
MIIILIDGMPYNYVNEDKAPFLNSIKRKGFKPGPGYSLNIYNELLAGKNPDDVGFFNIWKLKENHGLIPKLRSYAGSLLDLLITNFYLSRVMHYALFKFKILGADYSNIPFRLIPFVDKIPAKTVFEVDYETILTKYDFKVLNASKVNAKAGARDETLIGELKESVGKGNVFVLMADLDALAHKAGMSTEFDSHLLKCDKWVESVAAQCEMVGESLVILSDHGMKKVKESDSFSVNVEKACGRASSSSYLYFLDATMIRFWIYDESFRVKIESYMNSLEEVFEINKSRRSQLGITKKDFGDLIYFTKEGKYIHPCFLGSSHPLALHGYDPDFLSQEAYLGGININGTGEVDKAVDMYKFLNHNLTK